MTSGKADEDFFKARGFGIKIGFGERPALIVIDMINGFTDATMPLGAPLESQLAAQKPLIDAAHERSIPVIFSTVIYNDHDLKDAGLWAIKMKGTLTLKAGTPAVEVDKRLDMRPTDSLLVKILLAAAVAWSLRIAAGSPATTQNVGSFMMAIQARSGRRQVTSSTLNGSASMAPRGRFAIIRARVATSKSASSNESTPAMQAAAYSPTL